MSYRGSTRALALAAALMVTMGGARAAEDAKYPNWKGQWAQSQAGPGRPDGEVRSDQAWGPGSRPR